MSAENNEQFQQRINELQAENSKLKNDLATEQQAKQTAIDQLRAVTLDGVVAKAKTSDPALLKKLLSNESDPESAIEKLKKEHPSLFQANTDKSSTPGSIPNNQGKELTKDDLISDPKLAADLYKNNREAYSKLMNAERALN